MPPTDEWLADTLRSIGDAIIATDTLSRIVWMNSGAEALTGFSLADAQNRLLVDVLALYDEATGMPSVSPVYRLFDQREPPHCAVACYILRHAGRTERPVEVSCFRNVPAPETSGAILICRDLTSTRERESLLVRTERLDAIANLSGGLAHDLNNHLMVIQGYTDELRQLVGVGDQTPVVEIKQASFAAAAMTRNLQSIARRSTSHPEVLILSDLVAEMSGAISRLLGDNRTLRFIADPAKAKVNADRTLLKQVLTAMAVFARDAMPRGGEFCMEAGSMDVLDGQAIPGWNRVGPYARLLISDCGEGFDQQSLSRIFEPLCATRPVAFAQGIGLAQVHGIVAQCGGFIHALAAPGNRLAFEILLPRVYQFLPATGEAAPLRPKGDDAPLTVLLVEDDDSVRRVVHNYMERAGFNLLEAANAEEASDLAEVYEEPIHVLVTDVVLPGMSGRELADKLKSVRPELRVLLVSGFPRNNLGPAGSTNGHRFLPKPFTANQLLECVRSLVHEEVEPSRTL